MAWGLALLLAFTAAPGVALDCAPLAAAGSDDFGVLRHARGLLWKLNAPSGAESYLLGTMHVSDPRVVAITDSARPYFERADTFVMEVVLDVPAMTQLQGAMFLDDEQHLSAMLGEDFFARVSAAMQVRGVPPALTDTMKPWAVYSALSLPAEEQGVALDLAFMLQAQADGKRVVGLESVAEQVAVFEGIDQPMQLDLLRELTCHYATFQAELEAMVEAYVARDLAALVEISFRHASAHDARLLDALLWSRNARMLERLADILAGGKAFVAVGALHLPGARGLLSGLEARGYHLERLD